MSATNPPTENESRSSPTKPGSLQGLRTIQTLSWMITIIFLVALAWAVYQAVANGDALPIWAWLGVIALIAVVIGLVVMAVVYRGVSREVGPFDYRSSSKITGALKNETRRVEAGGASVLRAEIKMTQGILEMVSGATGVMEADFVYDDADWNPPEVEYAVDADGQGNLRMEQQATGRPTLRQGRCEWVVRLNQELPTELNVRFGAGKADLRLGGLLLDRLRVESGVGELALDLSGEWRRSLQATVKAGIGDTVVRLPKDAGIRIQPQVGFGSIHTNGLTWDGEAYTNALYGHVPVALDITVEGGMGKVSIESS